MEVLGNKPFPYLLTYLLLWFHFIGNAGIGREGGVIGLSVIIRQVHFVCLFCLFISLTQIHHLFVFLFSRCTYFPNA